MLSFRMSCAKGCHGKRFPQPQPFWQHIQWFSNACVGTNSVSPKKQTVQSERKWKKKTNKKKPKTKATHKPNNHKQKPHLSAFTCQPVLLSFSRHYRDASLGKNASISLLLLVQVPPGSSWLMIAQFFIKCSIIAVFNGCFSLLDYFLQWPFNSAFSNV